MIEVLKLFEPALYTDARIVDLLGGRGRGGSHFMAQHALIQLCTAKYFDAYFMRAVHKDIKTSLWKGFRQRFDEAVEQRIIDESWFAISDREMTIKNLRNGNEIRSKGFKTSSGGQTANLKSLEGAMTIYIEEAEEITKEQFTKLEDSLRTTKGKLQVFRAWNIPPKNHFLVNDYYDAESVELIDGNDIKHEGYFKLIPKRLPGHLTIFGTYKDNIRNIPEHKINTWENYFYTNPEHYFTDICGYASGGAKGVIFKQNINWGIYEDLPDIEFHETYGLDFGGGGINEGRKIYDELYKFDEPDGSSTTVLVKLLINKATMSVYVKLLLYKAYISPDNLSLVCQEQTIEESEGYKKKKNILADNARADKIQDLLNDKLNVIGAKTKEGGSRKVVSGIEIMKKYKIYFHKDDIPCHVDANNYKWEFNKTTGEPTGQPVKKYENVWDAIRYPLVNFDLYNW